MSSGIYIALSGAMAQSDALDVTANNVANAATAGTVSADGNEIGKLEIAQFASAALTHEGASLFALRPVAPGARPAAPPADAAPPEVVSGVLEAGNFNVVRGMVDLVRISRTYD